MLERDLSPHRGKCPSVDSVRLLFLRRPNSANTRSADATPDWSRFAIDATCAIWLTELIGSTG